MSEKSVCERDTMLDVFRGCAIISVIWIHTVYNSGGFYVPDNTIIKTLTLLFDVPFFMFLAGWSAYYRLDFRKMLKGIVRMWVFWIVLVTCIDIIYYSPNGQLLSGVFNVHYIWQILFQARGELLPNLPTFTSSLWYMPVYLSVLPIGTVLLFTGNTMGWKKMDYLYLMVLCIIAELYISAGINDTFFLFSTYIWFYLFFFLLGYYIKKYDISIRCIWTLLIGIICLGLLWYGCARLFGVSCRDLQSNKFPPNIVYLIASLIFVLLAIYMKDRITIRNNSLANKTLGFMGRNAFCFYFSQGIGGSLLYVVLRNFPFVCDWRLQLLIFFLINSTISIGTGIVFVVFQKGVYSLGRLIHGGISL